MQEYVKITIALFLAFLVLFGGNKALAEVKFTTKIINIDRKTENFLNEIITKNKNLLQKQSDVSQISNIANILEKKLIAALHSKGYFDANIKYIIDEEKKTNSITYNIDKGQIYKISSIKITQNNQLDDNKLYNKINLKISDEADATKVIAAQNDLANYVKNNYCFISIKFNHRAILDNGNKNVHIEFYMDDAKQAKFGEFKFSGLKELKADYVKSFIEFNQGRCFKPRLIDETRDKLFKTGFFSKVDILFDENKITSKEELPIDFFFEEGKFRTIKTGLNLSSDEGLGLKLGWENRNIFARGQKLAFDTNISSITKNIEGNYTQPKFMSSNQALNISSKFSEDNLDEFNSTNWNNSVGVSRKLQNNWLASLAASYKIASVEENNNTELFGLLNFPFHLEQDKRNDILNPNKGHYLKFEITPYIDSLNKANSFFKSRMHTNKYFPFKAKLSPVLALRFATGSITSDNIKDIPADERFYVGGANSVRGYGYQRITQNRDGNLVGGKSFVETSLEMRLKFTQKIGGVLFVDGGSSYENQYPKLGQDMSYGIGFGVRYYTDFLPLRFDVAFPTDDRNNRKYEYYISIGQAF